MPDERPGGSIAVAAAEQLKPGTSREVAELVRSARDDHAPLRIVGAGHWLAAGNPVHATRTLETSGLRGIVEYVPGDLTLTARAGTTLAEIADATSAHRQWLPLDPFGDPRGTLGATLATASAGPLGGSIGMPRDVTVGLAFVAGDGDIVHGGGRVVKNVAGFDLVRLTIGAWGTLGVITEATVRLRARPEADETLALELPHERDALSTLLSTIRAASVDLLAAELLSPVCAARAGLGEPESENGVLLARVAGNSLSAHHQRAGLARLTACEPVSAETWLRLRTSDPQDAAVVRVSRRPSELGRLWSAAMSIPNVDAHASLARGVVRLRLATGDMTSLDAFDPGDRRVIESGMPARTASIEVTPVDAVSGRLRDAFDPARILNRGILGEESR